MNRACPALFFVMLALLLFAMPTAHAATVSDGFDVLLQVNAACSVQANDHDFGSYDALLGNVGASMLTVRCTLLTPYSVGINGCTNGSGVSQRKLKLTTGTTLASYTLHCANALSGCFANWGNTPGTDTFDLIGTGIDVPIPVVGQVASGQNLPSGSYRDTCLATVTF